MRRSLLPKTEERLNKWRENGWSKPVETGNPNNNPLVVVPKKSGGVVDQDDIRLCIDARKLNALNKGGDYVMPRTTNIIKKAKQATMIADIDLKSAFHQILLDKRSSDLSAFTNPANDNREQMTRMWFGEQGAAYHCQKVVEKQLRIGEPGTEN